MRKPLSIIAYLLILLLLIGCARAFADDKATSSQSEKKAASGLLKADTGDKDFLAALNADTEKEPSAKEPPVYVTALSFIFKLGIVLALAYGTIYALKRFNGFKGTLGSGGQRIRVVENASLAANRSLHLIEIGSKRLLVASTPNQVNVITELDPDDSSNASDHATVQGPAVPAQVKNFKDQLSTFLGARPDTGDSARNVAHMLRESSMLLQERIMQVGRMRRKLRDAGIE